MDQDSLQTATFYIISRTCLRIQQLVTVPIIEMTAANSITSGTESWIFIASQRLSSLPSGFHGDFFG